MIVSELKDVIALFNNYSICCIHLFGVDDVEMVNSNVLSQYNITKNNVITIGYRRKVYSFPFQPLSM